MCMTSQILKSKPGEIHTEELPEFEEGVVPVIHCTQEIPCDPCSSLCSHGLIFVDTKDIRRVPTFLGNSYCCEVCERCVAGCPGLAITLVNYRENRDLPVVSIPYSSPSELIKLRTRSAFSTLRVRSSFSRGSVGPRIENNDRTLVVQSTLRQSTPSARPGSRYDEEVHPPA